MPPHPVTPRDALRYEQKVLDGNCTSEVLAWLQAGFRLHIETGLPLARCLHLPTTPAARKIALRDLYLREALKAHGGTPWQTAKAIRALHWKIARWIRRGEHRASNAFERAVYEAARHAPPPERERAIYEVLRAAVSDCTHDDSRPEVG